MTTTSNDALLMSTLQELKDGQQRIHDKLDTIVGVQSGHGERLATLEAERGRFITYKQLVMWMIGGAGGGSTLIVGAYHFIANGGG